MRNVLVAVTVHLFHSWSCKSALPNSEFLHFMAQQWTLLIVCQHRYWCKQSAFGGEFQGRQELKMYWWFTAGSHFMNNSSTTFSYSSFSTVRKGSFYKGFILQNERINTKEHGRAFSTSVLPSCGEPQRWLEKVTPWQLQKCVKARKQSIIKKLKPTWFKYR